MSNDDPGRPTPDEDRDDTPEAESPYPWMQLEPEEEPAPPFRPWMIAVAGLSVVIFVVAVWYAWNEGQSVGDGPPPVVEADDTPVKTPPEEPGGMDVPHQEKTVFNAIEDDGGETDEEELLPPPEEPVERSAQPSEAEADADMAEATAPQEDDSESVSGEAQEPAAETGDDAETPAPAASDTQDGAENAQADTTSPTETEDTADTAETEVAQAETDAAESPSPTAGGYAIQLAAVGSRESAEQAWARFLKTYPRILGPLALDVQPVEAGGRTLYRVRGAGIADRAKAEALCEDLKDQGQSCLVKER